MTDRDEGAVTIVVALSLIVLFGMGALVLDVGNLYWERRQLQNGAEAGALAAAQDYVDGAGAAAAAASARTYASANNERNAFVEDIFQPTANSVTVETITGDSGSAGVLDAFLAGVIGNDTYFARASATATWGGFGGGATIPLTFSECEWNHLTGGNVANLSTAERTVYFHSSQTAKSINTCGGPANQDHPGGFGWLDTNGPGCSAIVNMGLVDTKTGNSVPNDCSEAYLEDLVGGEPVLLPIFDAILNAQGNNATYQIVGFAALEVTGYRFSGSKFNEPAGDVPCSGDDRCIRGRFVAYYDLGSEPAAGTPDYGAYVIGLTG